MSLAKLAAKASKPDEEDYGSLWKVTELSQNISFFSHLQILRKNSFAEVL